MGEHQVSVKCRKVSHVLDARTVRRQSERLLEHLKMDRAKLSVLLCDDAFIRRLNKEYRKMDQPTDVLSFSMREGEFFVGDSEELGDIVVSVETAMRQAPIVGHSVTREVMSLIVHGLLHLLGYHHSDSVSEEQMLGVARTLETRVLDG